MTVIDALQNQVKKLQAENKRLKGENAKLKCLVLHAMFKWAAAMACFFSYKIDDCDKKEVKRNIGKMNRYDKKADKYCKAYHKAKAELKEGK